MKLKQGHKKLTGMTTGKANKGMWSRVSNTGRK